MLKEKTESLSQFNNGFNIYLIKTKNNLSKIKVIFLFHCNNHNIILSKKKK